VLVLDQIFICISSTCGLTQDSLMRILLGIDLLQVWLTNAILDRNWPKCALINLASILLTILVILLCLMPNNFTCQEGGVLCINACVNELCGA
jgi:glucan phosphoethanolaminetransferase (alkaline phosphatase superfamily)